MTTPDKILVDLLISDSTTDALAERVKIPMLAVKAMCQRHEIDGLATHTNLADSISVWSLTDSGREVARTLQPAPALA